MNADIAERPDITAYIACMEEIKRRITAIDEVLSGRRNTSFKYTDIEFAGLQFRKIFELLIFASMASNRSTIEPILDEINREWRIKNAIRLIKRANPDFYPTPIDLQPSSKAGVRDDWIDKATGFLTCDELVRAHEKLGELLHSRSPYRDAIPVEQFERMFEELREKTITLLDNHIVSMPSGEIKLYVGMSSAESGAVHCAVFAKLPT